MTNQPPPADTTQSVTQLDDAERKRTAARTEIIQRAFRTGEAYIAAEKQDGQIEIDTVDHFLSKERTF